jgi:hypothetical protein
MTSIVAGRFETFEQAEGAVQALNNADIDQNDVSVFYVNPPGQHDATPSAGDHAKSAPDAMEGENTIVSGATVGGAIGLAMGIAAAVPIVDAAIAVTAMGVGAYTGSFAGNLNGAGEGEHAVPAPRRAGVLVAVSLTGNDAIERASRILSEQGGEDIELADGVLRDGQWIDFNPITPQRFISAPMDLP